MNRVLKNGDGAIDDLVRPFRSLESEKLSDSEENSRQLDQTRNGDDPSPKKHSGSGVSQRAFADVAGQNEKLLLSLEEAKKEIEKVKESAFAAGRKEGLAEAITSNEKKTELVAKASELAVQNFSETMESLEGLAILLARTTVIKVLGPDQHMSDLVTQSIKHHVGALTDAGAITLSISPADFSSEQDIALIEEQVAYPFLEVIADNKLSSGDCLLKMKLGIVDIGIPGQLKKISTLLDQMIDGEGA